jgi:hypothetical protein
MPINQPTAPFSLHLFDTTPSPHGRINAPSLLLAFAHIHGETGTPTLGICSAVVGWTGPFLCAEGVDISMPIIQTTAPFSLHLFDTTPSPHGRINAPSLLLAFAHIHGEAGTPTLGHLQCSGGSDWSVSMCSRGGLKFCHAKESTSGPILATFI